MLRLKLIHISNRDLGSVSRTIKWIWNRDISSIDWHLRNLQPWMLHSVSWVNVYVHWIHLISFGLNTFIYAQSGNSLHKLWYPSCVCMCVCVCVWRGHSVCWRIGVWDIGFESCIQQRKTTCLLSIRISLACARASKLTSNIIYRYWDKYSALYCMMNQYYVGLLLL